MLHDGQGFCVIEEANPFSKCVEVIKVHFLDDKCVLVSLLPRRRSKGAGFSSVVAYGNDQVPEVIVARTFFDEPSKFVPPRSRSADNAPSANSCWSVGTISHDENNPGACEICPIHHRYLLDETSPGAQTATPCPLGAACTKCHERHPEQEG